MFSITLLLFYYFLTTVCEHVFGEKVNITTAEISNKALMGVAECTLVEPKKWPLDVVRWMAEEGIK